MALGLAGVPIVASADTVGVVHSHEHALVLIHLLNMVAMVVKENPTRLIHVGIKFVQLLCTMYYNLQDEFQWQFR